MWQHFLSLNSWVHDPFLKMGSLRGKWIKKGAAAMVLAGVLGISYPVEVQAATPMQTVASVNSVTAEIDGKADSNRDAQDRQSDAQQLRRSGIPESPHGVPPTLSGVPGNPNLNRLDVDWGRVVRVLTSLAECETVRYAVFGWDPVAHCIPSPDGKTWLLVLLPF